MSLVNTEKQVSSPKRNICGIDLCHHCYFTTGASEDDVRLSDGYIYGHIYTTKYIHSSYPIKHLLGQKFSELQYVLPYLRGHAIEGPDGFPLFEYGNDLVTPTEHVTLILSDCKKERFEGLEKENVLDCCIGVPIHFTGKKRRELLHAAKAANLTPHRLLHETTAVALHYRFSRGSGTNSLKDGESLHVAFIDVGYWSMQVSMVELKKDGLRILSHVYDKSLGGLGFDQVLAQHFQKKCTFGVLDKKYSGFIEKCVVTKQNLSRQTTCEMVYDGVNYGVIERTKFEELSTKLLERIEVVLQKAMDEARLNVKNIYNVELLGEGTRMPAIVNIVENFFQKQPKRTIAHPVDGGCYIQCALLCLASKLPKFQIRDILPCSIELDDMTEKQVLFRKGSPLPSTQKMMFLQSSTFFLDLLYVEPEDSEGSSDMISYMIGPFQSCEGEMEVTVTVKLDLNGIAFIESATIGDTVLRIVEHSCPRLHAEHLQNLTQSELETTFRRDTVLKEVNDISMKIESCLKMETKRRIETELTLEELRSEYQKLQESNAELKLQLSDSSRKFDAALELQHSELSQSKLGNYVEFSVVELKEVTNNFDESCRIGGGGFGDVYKGFLRHTYVAIKILKSKSSQGDIEFNQEMEILTKIRHPNLVSLIGANPEAWALVFEFVPNGGLNTFLSRNKKSQKKLSWEDRIRIASEICSALIFLHSVPPYGIVHGDLKPENILLDSNLVSKLADFGISRKLNKIDDRSTIFYQSENPKFTQAYCAPEFYSSFELTAQYDIYSFGIILLELLTGRHPNSIMGYVKKALETDKLGEELDGTAGEWPIEVAKKWAILGLWCCHIEWKERPSLREDVWPSIDSIKEVAGLH